VPGWPWMYVSAMAGTDKASMNSRGINLFIFQPPV